MCDSPILFPHAVAFEIIKDLFNCVHQCLLSSSTYGIVAQVINDYILEFLHVNTSSQDHGIMHTLFTVLKNAEE